MKWVLRFFIVVAVIAVAGYLGVNYAINSIIRSKTDEKLAEWERYVHVEYDSFHYSLLNQTTRLKGVEATPKDGTGLKFLMDSLLVDRAEFDKEHNVLKSMHLNIDGLRIHRKNEQDAYSPALAPLGYEDPSLAVELDYDYNPEEGFLHLETLKLKGEEMGDLGLKLDLGQLSGKSLGQLSFSNVMQSAMAFSSVNFHEAELVFEDKGLTDRLLDHQANEAGISRDQHVDRIVSSIESWKRFRPDKQTLGIIESFLRSPDRLRIAAEPSRPVNSITAGFAILGKANLMDLYGVSVTN